MLAGMLVHTAYAQGSTDGSGTGTNTSDTATGTHSKSSMPLTKEFRFFFFDAQRLYSSEYWMEGDYRNGKPPLEMFQEIAGQVHSRFFTMDVAQRIDGEWMIVELGDGQVAGLPNQMDAGLFYQALQNRV